MFSLQGDFRKSYNSQTMANASNLEVVTENTNATEKENEDKEIELESIEDHIRVVARFSQ